MVWTRIITNSILLGGRFFPGRGNTGGSFWRTWNVLEWACVVQCVVGAIACGLLHFSAHQRPRDSRTDSQPRVLSMNDLAHCNWMNRRLTCYKKGLLYHIQVWEKAWEMSFPENVDGLWEQQMRLFEIETISDNLGLKVPIAKFPSQFVFQHSKE